MAKTSGLIIYESFFKVIDRKSDADRLALYDALARYHFKGVYPDDLAPHLMDCFELMQPNIDKSSAQYEACVANGKKGGRPRKIQPEKPNAKTKAVNHDKEKEKDKERDTSPFSRGEVIPDSFPEF
nr:DUF6291 domain-containing protein [uncultured Oscillibacter sp.]